MRKSLLALFFFAGISMGFAQSDWIDLRAGGAGNNNIRYYVDPYYFFHALPLAQPAVTGCGVGCSVAGNDHAFRITIGASGSTGTINVTFGHLWDNPPFCYPRNRTTNMSFKGDATTAGIALDPSSVGYAFSDTIDMLCNGI